MSRRGTARRHRKIHASPRREDLDLVTGRWKVSLLSHKTCEPPILLHTLFTTAVCLPVCLPACLPACVCVQVVEVVYEPSVRHSDSDDEGGADVSGHMDIAGQFKG